MAPNLAEGLTRSVRRPVGAAVLLLLAYLGVSLLMDSEGYLGADTGVKVATLEAMSRAGSTTPDVGYWAEQWDPGGEVHPLYETARMSDGSWVAVTTLPMLELALPLYRLGGYRAALLLPMLGALGCALAARSLARRLGEGDGMSTFWVVGLGSPITLYALDFWEHSLGVATVVTSVALLMDGVAGVRSWWRPLAVGLLLGVGASLRTEVLVYALVAVGVSCAVMLSQRRPGRAFGWGAGAVVGFTGAWAANRALELAVGGIARVERATAAAEGVVGSAASLSDSRADERINEALVTSLGMKGASSSSWVIGIGVIAVLLLAYRADRRGDRVLTAVCFVLAGVVYLVSALADLSFIPGLLLAFPVALGALLVRQRGDRGVVLVVALGALPLVWAFQYLGGAGPQWGGRYILVSAVLLGTLATSSAVGRAGTIGRGLVVLSVCVTVLGLTWTGVRTRAVADLARDLRSVDADVVIMRDAFLLGELGTDVLDEQWLAADGEDGYRAAIGVAERSGARRVAVVELDAPAPPLSAVPDGWTEVERIETDLTGALIGIAVYALPTGS